MHILLSTMVTLARKRLVVIFNVFLYWTHMQWDVIHFLRHCAVFCRSKLANRKASLSFPLPIPSRPWEQISLDLISVFPMTVHHHDYIFVIVDRFIKIDKFIPCHKTSSTSELAQLFFDFVWRSFGLPPSIVSDHE
jgi:hypothetical protein